jgi:tRNA1(Val) A37 N6-methylase TrmN6
LVELARRNVDLNGLAERLTIIAGDVFGRSTALKRGSFDEVFANPPYLEAAAAAASPDPLKAKATVEGGASLNDWITVALGLARTKGWITLIHRADRLAGLLSSLHGRTGEIAVFPLWPRSGEPARRVIVRARKGSRGPLRLLPGLVLHRADGSYTAAADAVLTDGAPLVL